MTNLNYINKIDCSLDFRLIESNCDTKFSAMLILAESGDHSAQRWIADSYYYGQGIAQDQRLALKWYLTAAESGDPIAQSFLGLCFEHAQFNAQTLNLNTEDWFANILL